MADPLSLFASIVATVGAAERVSKAQMKIQSLDNVPDELLVLINEVLKFEPFLVTSRAL